MRSTGISKFPSNNGFYMLQRESDFLKQHPSASYIEAHANMPCSNPTSPVGSKKKGWISQRFRGHPTSYALNIFSTPLVKKKESLLQVMSGNCSSSAGTISVLHSCGETASKSLFQQPGSTYSFITKSSTLEASEPR